MTDNTDLESQVGPGGDVPNTIFTPCDVFLPPTLPGVPYSAAGVPYSAAGVPYSAAGVPYSDPGVPKIKPKVIF